MAFRGLGELQSALLRKTQLEAVKTVVKKNGSRLQEQAQQGAPVDTGNLRRSIGLEIEDAGLTACSAAKAHYSGYVELGTRFMAAQPYMKPAFNVVKTQFKSDLQRLVK